MASYHSKPSLLRLCHCVLLQVLVVDIFLFGFGAQAEVVVRDLNSNETAAIFPDMQASFGGDYPKHGMKGRVIIAEPKTACGPLKKAPPKIDHYVWIVLIERGGCPFTEKVLNAQKANFCSAIVFNYPGNQGLTKMGGDSSKIEIPSTFVGFNSGMDLATQYNYPRFKEFVINIEEEEEIDYRMYLLPFAIVVGVCFLMIMLFLVIRFVRDHTRGRVARLSKKHLKKIPIRKFKKGQYYDTCAICLEEYEDGEKIRVLPCDHAYHASCIDPWLTRNKKTCPVCKRRVIPGKDPNSEGSDSDSEGGETSQTTPLLMSSSSQRSHGSMNQVDADTGPAPRAQSAPALFEATVVVEAGGAMGGFGTSTMSDGSSTSHGGAMVKVVELDSDRGEQREGRRKKRERREEEDHGLVLGMEDEEEEEEERRKAERKERRRKKKEKKKKSKRGSVRGGAEGRDGGESSRLLVEAELENVPEVSTSNYGEGPSGVVVRSTGSGGAEGGIVEDVDEEEGHRGGRVNTGYSDSQELVVPPPTRKGKKREMSEVV